MSSTGLSAWAFLARRWLVSRAVRRAAVLLAVAFALLGAVYVSVQAFSLSGDQQADELLGRYEQATFTSVDPGDLKSDFLITGEASLNRQVPDSHLIITSVQLTPDSYTKAFVKASIPTVSFVEDRDLRATYPDRYSLRSGQWPQAVSEVAISAHLAAALGNPSSFTAMSGHATFRVVGIVGDAFAEKGDLIVAAPGTWEAIARPAAGHSYQPVQAQVDAFWGSSESLASVTKVMQSILPALPKDQGDRSDDLSTNLSTRSEIAETPVVSFGSSNIVVSYLPLLLVVLLVSALVVRQTRTESLANAERLLTLGVRRRGSRLTQVVALGLASFGAIVLGTGVGWLIGVLLRQVVLPHYDNQPLSPLPGVTGAAWAIAGASLLVIVAGTLWPQRAIAPVHRLSATGRLASLFFAMARRGVAVVAIVFASSAGRNTENDTVRASYLAVLAVVLLVPDLVALALLLLSRARARTFMTRRLMTADRGRQAIAAVVVACCTAVPICAATEIASQKVSRSAGSYSLVPPRQLWVQSGTGITGVAEVGKIVAGVPGVGPAIPVRGLADQEKVHDPDSDYAHFLYVPASGNYNSYVLVLSTAADLNRIVGDTVPAAAESTLAAGGVLDFTGAVGDQRFVVDSADGKRRVLAQSLPTLHVQLDPQFSQQYAGVVLLATAQKLSLPIGDPTKFIFTGVTTPVIDQAVRATVDAGYDSRFVQYNVTPPPPDIPTTWYIFLSALVLGGFVVLLLVIRGQAVRLRGYSSRLLAMGLTPGWLLSVLGIQAGLIIGVGLAGGIAAGVLGIVIVTDSYLRLSVPIVPIVLSCVATVVAAALATASAVRALTATESPDVN